MLSKAILMGRLTADPELRHTPNQVPVTSFTLAVSRAAQKDTVDFIDIVAWRKTAEFACKYFQKGMQIAVCGSLQTRVWKDREGNNKKAVEVIADEVFFAGSKKAGGQYEPAPPGFDPGIDAGGFQGLDDDDALPF